MSSSSLFASLGAALQAFPSPRFTLRIASPTAKHQPVLNAFETELASQLEQLKSTNEAGYLNMPWLCQAMGVVLCTHANAEAFVADFRQAVGEGNDKWLDEYLDDSVKLLDACNVLRDTVGEIRNYHMLLGVAIQSLEKGSMCEGQIRRAKNVLSRCTEGLKRSDEELSQKRSRLETCSSMLRRMGEKLDLEDASKGNFFSAIYAAQVTTIFICGVMVVGLCFKPRRSLCNINVGGQSPWAFSLSSLQQRVKEEVERKKAKGCSAFLEELEKADIGVRRLQELLKALPVGEEQRKEVREVVEHLKTCWVDLEGGLSPLEHQINQLFRVLIASRMLLLDIYSHS